MIEHHNKAARAGLSIKSLPYDLLQDAGGSPENLPRAALLEQGGFVFFFNLLMREHGIVPRGAIHLGANIGQEALPYMMCGFDKVLFVEAHPKVYLELVENVKQLNRLNDELSAFLRTHKGTRFEALKAAVGERNQQATLYLTGSSLFYSTRRPVDFSQWFDFVVERSSAAEAQEFLQWAEQAVKLKGELKVEMRTLDDLLAKDLPADWVPSDFNVISMNIQGAELDALAGARHTLSRIQLIQLEKNYTEHYEGNPTAAELDDFLSTEGFREVTTIRAGSVGTSAYVRT